MPPSPPRPDPILAAALDAVITIDRRGHVVDLNPAAERMFGYARYTALGRPVDELIVPTRLRDAHRKGLERVLAGGPQRIIDRRVELSALRSDGQEIPVELAVTQTRRVPPLFTAWIRDISEQKRVEAQSARRGRVLARSEELAGIGSWAWRLEDDELLWSDNLFRILGLEPGSVRPSLELLLERTHPEDRGRLQRELETRRHDGALPPIALRIVRPDGTVRHLRATAAVEDDEALGPQSLIGAVHDVTEQQRAEREIAAHVAVSEALTQWTSFDVSGERLLGDLASALGFTVGTIWTRNGDDALVRRVSWTAPHVVDAECAVGGAEALRCDELAHTAFALRQPCLDQGRVAFPAVAGDCALAVIEVGSTEPAELTPRLTRMLTGIGYELGAFLARRRGELKTPQLTPRELEVLQLAAHGLGGRQIAERLVLSPATVKSHFENIYARLGVSDRAAAVAHALREGLID